MAEDQPGFEIAGAFYPFPDSYTIGDSVLVRMLTGLDMEEFGELLADSDDENAESRSDPRLLIGLIGVAVWHKHSKWSVERVARFVQNTDISLLDFPDAGAEESDALPPDGRADGPETETEPDDGSQLPAETSNDEPASDSAALSLTPTGSPE